MSGARATELAVRLDEATDTDVRAGMRTRREVLGDAYVDGALERAAGTGDTLQDLVTRNVWGALWGRDALDRRSRSLVTVAVLVAGGHHDELRAHTRGALRNGLTPDEVVEVVLHCSGYCGAPRALAAMRVVREVLDAEPTEVRDEA